jgi:glyoxylase-like metal-dependent hydrolase (beta-lactamase superfamily II)
MANPALVTIAGRTHVVRGPANVGIVEQGDGTVVLIDSGNDDDAGRKLLKLMEGAGWTLARIANTHSNADHCGGNAFLQSRTGCAISATRAEAAFIETPLLEPSFLWGGFPPATLRSKFLMAKPSRVTDILNPPCPVTGTQIQTVSLPGHFLDMVGFMTPDHVFFAADTVASAEILSKYHVFYLYDIAAHLKCLEALARIDAEWVVPSHAEPVRDVRPLVDLNRSKVLEIAGFLRAACQEPSTPEMLLAALCEHYGIVLNPAQHALVGSTLRAYLAWLMDQGEVETRFDAGRLWLEQR